MKLALLLLAACAAQNTELERKVDLLAKNQRDPAELARKVDEFAAQVAQLRAKDSEVSQLEQKLDALMAAQQKLINTPPPPRPSRPSPDRAKSYAIAIDGDPFIGPGDAKVTMVLFYDYADPYTDKNRDVRDELRKKYGNDLRIVYKPFVVHPQVATAAALAACAAQKQHKFVDYDKLLWEKGFKARQFDKSDVPDASPPQKCWASPTGCAVTLGFAKELHLDVGRFKVDMQACAPWLEGEMKSAQVFGVGATPTFAINGRFLSGAMPIENFTPVIDEELKRANERIQLGTKPARYYEEWIVGKGEKSL